MLLATLVLTSHELGTNLRFVTKTDRARVVERYRERERDASGVSQL